METKTLLTEREEKVALLKVAIEKEKKFWMWVVIGVTILGILCIGFLIPNDWKFALALIAVVFFIDDALTTKFHMGATEKRLQKWIKDERGHIESVIKDSQRITALGFMDMPSSLKPTARYLLSEELMSPMEIIEERKEQFEDIKTELEIVKLYPERNFWQYLLSRKWLKQIN